MAFGQGAAVTSCLKGGTLFECVPKGTLSIGTLFEGWQFQDSMLRSMPEPKGGLKLATSTALTRLCQICPILLSLQLERSVCSGAKGIFAMMVLALISAISGMFMACLGARKPVLVLIPGALCAFFLALAVVSYGGAISSAYPDSSDNLLDVRVSSLHFWGLWIDPAS